jgi:O-antigen/teichoic acid export membrane protein
MSDARHADAGRRPSLVSAAVATYGANLAASLLSLVNVLIIARALGPVGRGDVAFLITVAILTSHVGTLSVQEANANIGGVRPALRPGLASNSLLLSLACGAATIGVVAGLVAAFPAVGGEPDRVVLWVALGSIPVLILRRYLNFLVQAEYGFTVTNVAWVIGPAITSVTNGLLAGLGVLSTSAAIGTWVAGQLLGTGLLVGYVARRSGFGRPDARLAAESLGFGL